ncbi:MAG: molybdenum cofactor guanylyltransferase [Scytolyngbya sp. HA4215-MV1]|jgi:molybdopterin-guanine dinucleotide biosynthesis protein A|nr:molybdenum cofactor guanylyltransferase [Scytolyngbya sp. HA4215-MV1]
MHQLTTIVLAGGQSTRMGQDKALISIQGVPLLRRVCKVALQCSDRVLVVTSRLAEYQPILPPLCHIVLETVPTGEKPPGPLVGFSQGLAQVQTDWVLLLACDLPNLQTRVLQTWTTQLAHVENTTIALLPRHAKGWEPLCGFYRRTCLASLTQFIAQGGRSFQGWLKTQSVQPLSLVDQSLLFNCNTPADMLSLIESYNAK